MVVLAIPLRIHIPFNIYRTFAGFYFLFPSYEVQVYKRLAQMAESGATQECHCVEIVPRLISVAIIVPGLLTHLDIFHFSNLHIYMPAGSSRPACPKQTKGRHASRPFFLSPQVSFWKCHLRRIHRARFLAAV
ncbi:hypothetical protein BCR43DRAFT_306269 [Syncephalastrum racemosum]|uniref:Uncharacterized protein n=1 Tax=Syncephalastrum racemosum TaxID=13706 RepID=A0A1X2HAC6_SYNRA|nr:hypothetical protein BCR43DRAFT_306269 [Syncephalastrum racemosum]